MAANESKKSEDTKPAANPAHPPQAETTPGSRPAPSPSSVSMSPSALPPSSQPVLSPSGPATSHVSATGPSVQSPSGQPMPSVHGPSLPSAQPPFLYQPVNPVMNRQIETQEYPQIPLQNRGYAQPSPIDSVMRWPPPAATSAPPQGIAPIGPHAPGSGHPSGHPQAPSGQRPPAYYTGTPMAGETTMIARREAKNQAQESQQAQPTLVVMTGNMAGQIFVIQSERTLLGRSPDCEVSLFDIDISRIHAEIRMSPQKQLILRDFNSTNGTYVNGQQITQCDLKGGDRIQLGCSTILKFSYHSEIEEKYQRRLYENAVLDGLTQIFNRKFFEERLHTEFSFARRHNSPVSLMILDIDHFKLVNDRYGHPAGDQVLRMVAKTIHDLLRKEDIVARYGGEEFGIIARGIQPTQAAILAERIRSSIEHLDVPSPAGLPIRVTVSIGAITMTHEPFLSAQHLLQEVDNRLYQAKRQGRNCVVA